MKLDGLVLFPLFLLPDRYRGVSGGHTTEAWFIRVIRVSFQTFIRAFQAHKAELYFTSRTKNTFTLVVAVLQEQTTGGTGTDGGGTHRLPPQTQR